MTSPRVAIVTGAAQGIGAGVAIRLAEDGLAVAVLDIDGTTCADTVATITKAGGTAVAIGCDVSDRGQVEAAVQRTVDELGPPTVVVNNAGVTRDALLFKMTDDEWRRVLDVHLTGTFLITQSGITC